MNRLNGMCNSAVVLMTTVMLSLATVTTTTVRASESAIPLSHASINLSDRGSLQNGAKLFINYCLSCHSAEFMRYERMAADLGISESVLIDNMMFASDKVGETMLTTMSDKDAKAWFGKVPPDLSVISRARKPDYIYTYLTSFYRDPSTVSGWNNAVLANAAMPHVMYELQGEQVLAHHEEGGEKSSESGDDHGSSPLFELKSAGTMTPGEFDSAMQDLTNFLVYMAEPAALSRVKIGFWVLAFLGILLFLTWLLKQEYWRDIYGDQKH